MLFSFTALPKLENISFAKGCFVSSEKIEGEFHISNCMQLQSIIMDDDSFKYYSTFNINELPSLTSIHFGMNCFCYCNDFVLKGKLE